MFANMHRPADRPRCRHLLALLLFRFLSGLVAAGYQQVSFKPARGIVLRYISEAEAVEFVIPPFEVSIWGTVVVHPGRVYYYAPWTCLWWHAAG